MGEDGAGRAWTAYAGLPPFMAAAALSMALLLLFMEAALLFTAVAPP